MKASILNLIFHYKKLIYFTKHRFEFDNRLFMREYFCQVLIDEMEKYVSLRGKRVLDVGGGFGEFCRYLYVERKCTAVNLDPREQKQHSWYLHANGYADDIPFGEETFDIVICRGVLEHIPPQKLKESVSEMFRVLRSNGYAYFLIPPWFSPHAGHSLKPFHYFPFKIAKYLRDLFFKKKCKWGDEILDPQSWEEAMLYPRIITFGSTMRLLKEAGFEIIDTLDTHLRLHFLTKIPVINEIFVPSVAFICKKRN